MEDNEIIRLYQQRDEAAVRQTELKYSRYLHTIAMNILGSREDSGECVNDTYLRAWNAIPPDLPTRLAAYLGKITRRLSIGRLRKSSAAKRGGSQYDVSLEELSECIPSGSSPEKQAEARLLADVIEGYLRGCSAQMRTVFLRRYFFCDSVKAIARDNKMSEPKVKSMLSRARAGLRECLEKEGFSV